MNQLTTKDFFNNKNIIKRFEDVLGKNGNAYVNSIISVCSSNIALNNNPQSVMIAAMKAAVLNLPIEPSLGFAYIVPYGREAQFQLGYKGLIQLALRSGQIKNVNSGIVYKSQFIKYDPLFEELDVDFSQKSEGEVAGYFASLRLVNGFEKIVYWTYEQVYNHGKRFSKSFSKGPWKTDFNAMAMKTVLKSLLSTYAPLSLEMADAISEDNKGEDMTSSLKQAEEVTPFVLEEVSDVEVDENEAEAVEQTQESEALTLEF